MPVGMTVRLWHWHRKLLLFKAQILMLSVQFLLPHWLVISYILIYPLLRRIFVSFCPFSCLSGWTSVLSFVLHVQSITLSANPSSICLFVKTTFYNLKAWQTIRKYTEVLWAMWLYRIQLLCQASPHCWTGVWSRTNGNVRSQKADRNPPDPVHCSDINYEEGCELLMQRWTKEWCFAISKDVMYYKWVDHMSS